MSRRAFAEQTNARSQNEPRADYTLRIAATPIEIAPKQIISVTTYNGQFPGPLLRLKEGQQVTVDLLNYTDTPEQLHWHGQLVPVDVDGAAEEGTPFSRSWKAPHLLRATACGLSLATLAHAFFSLHNLSFSSMRQIEHPTAGGAALSRVPRISGSSPAMPVINKAPCNGQTTGTTNRLADNQNRSELLLYFCAG